MRSVRQRAGERRSVPAPGIRMLFDRPVERIAAGIAALLDIALGIEMQTRHGGFRVLLIAPPKILEQGPIADQFIGAASKSAASPASATR